jgi:hypothetical protein
MKNFRFFTVFAFLVCASSALWAQNEIESPKADENLVQFSGIIVTEEAGKMVPVPYAGVFSSRRKVGTSANYRGFFSFVAEKGESIRFTALGFRNAIFKIPNDLKDDRYSMVQIMSHDTLLLDEAIIFPWPSREHFRSEFLAMNVNDELGRRAAENLSAETLERVRTNTTPDGQESSSTYLRQQASSYYYYGQTPPMNIFNPMAWSKFFSSWKNGDFKKKKKGSGG